MKTPNPSILVVEDEIPLLDVITRKLENAGLDVVSARSVDQALDYLENMESISAVWLDHYLLGRDDGLVLVAQLKNDDSPYKSIPVFVVSNTASDNKVHQYLSLGIDKYFVKAENALDKIITSILIAIKNGE